MFRVGLISDTHGLLRNEVVEFLRGSDYVIHAGDVGDPRILRALGVLAPVTVVRGNNDHGTWAERLPDTRLLRVDHVAIYVIHDRSQLGDEPRAPGVRVVVSGHSHKPSVEEHRGVLFVNPGSAGPRRFRLPIAAAELLVDGHSAVARITEFPIPAVRARG